MTVSEPLIMDEAAMRGGMVKVEGGQVGMLAVEPRMMDEVAMRDKAGSKS